MIGGVIPVLIKLAKAAFSTDAPFNLRKWWLWVGIAAMIFLGGLAPTLFQLDGLTVPNGSPRLVTMLFGAAAPDLFARTIGILLDRVNPPSASLSASTGGLAAFLRI
jgi:hypothetical protein